VDGRPGPNVIFHAIMHPLVIDAVGLRSMYDVVMPK
jgi:hypothetical protein